MPRPPTDPKQPQKPISPSRVKELQEQADMKEQKYGVYRDSGRIPHSWVSKDKARTSKVRTCVVDLAN